MFVTAIASSFLKWEIVIMKSSFIKNVDLVEIQKFSSDRVLMQQSLRLRQRNDIQMVGSLSERFRKCLLSHVDKKPILQTVLQIEKNAGYIMIGIWRY